MRRGARGRVFGGEFWGAPARRSALRSTRGFETGPELEWTFRRFRKWRPPQSVSSTLSSLAPTVLRQGELELLTDLWVQTVHGVRLLVGMVAGQGLGSSNAMMMWLGVGFVGTASCVLA